MFIIPAAKKQIRVPWTLLSSQLPLISETWVSGLFTQAHMYTHIWVYKHTLHSVTCRCKVSRDGDSRVRENSEVDTEYSTPNYKMCRVAAGVTEVNRRNI